ncbi:hypothetical protein HK100_002814 [Physocladia obscura]|uniref:Uncharacterized protein n=1 Tax=Physocladia obscura TaxID=109957 RepID=A0AAD5T7Z6_9FUNG|nr:hypothetical protein HK100_002814 [Physocladia obscura]
MQKYIPVLLIFKLVKDNLEMQIALFYAGILTFLSAWLQHQQPTTLETRLLKCTRAKMDVASVDELNTLVSSGMATLSYPGILVNCPVVHPNSTLEVASDGETVFGYYKDMLVKYFDFGVNGANTGNNYLEPVWVIKDISGTQSDKHVFSGVNTDPGYTAFWYVDFVAATAGYVANT